MISKRYTADTDKAFGPLVFNACTQVTRNPKPETRISYLDFDACAQASPYSEPRFLNTEPQNNRSPSRC